MLSKNEAAQHWLITTNKEVSRCFLQTIFQKNIIIPIQIFFIKFQQTKTNGDACGLWLCVNMLV